jgi:hypothetical protein
MCESVPILGGMDSWYLICTLELLWTQRTRDKASSIYQHCLEVGFQALKDLKESPIVFDIHFGKYMKQMKVIGNQKSNDLLCLAV